MKSRDFRKEMRGGGRKEKGRSGMKETGRQDRQTSLKELVGVGDRRERGGQEWTKYE